MIAASGPARPHRILRIEGGTSSSVPAADFPGLFQPGDLLVINDAATLPASLSGLHERTGQAIELRLAARDSLEPRRVSVWDAVLFGEGDHRTPTEARSAPPAVLPGDVLTFGPLHARVDAVLGHPRLLRIAFAGTSESIWQGLARQGRPIQYAHVPEPLALWDVWTKIAGPPVALEAPSAGYLLDWATLAALPDRGVEVVSLTHAAGLSSTGDAALDRRLPLPEPYAIGAGTALAVQRTRLALGRVIALGTTVARALESAADAAGRVRAGKGLATLRLGPDSMPRVVDVIVSGVHERGTSHDALLRAFVDDATLDEALARMEAEHFRHHEFGDAVWVARSPRARAPTVAPMEGLRAK